ncbi:hypothetical protein ACO2Q2_15405 [Dyella sp. KRB-257]|uniref:hypothetical protein n=1 Tax=Dyella sp. KRB-257 TaxID=3400915 RepID=UPI003C08E4AA
MFVRILKSILVYTTKILCVTSFLVVAGCGKKDLSPPSVNSAPHDAIDITFRLNGKRDLSKYRITGQIEYGNLSNICSNIHSLDGGWVEYPHDYISVDGRNNSFKIYRDYYQPRGDCSWRLLGLSIDIYDENGRLAVGGLPANSLQPGYSVTLHCNFSNKWSGNCLPGEAGRVRTDLTVDISIN